MVKRKISFEVKTESYDFYNRMWGSQLIFYTKAVNGKEALNRMLKKSKDFKQLLGKRESNKIRITIQTFRESFKKEVAK